MAASLARDLLNQGYAVVPIFPACEQLQGDFAAMLGTFPEYLPGATQLVGGSFGGLGNAASFHHPLVRQLRARVMAELLPVFSELSLLTNFPNLEQLVDRVCVRPVGTRQSRELPHRDESPGDGLVLGGWLSVKGTQTFRCSPGSHGDGKGQGFCKLTAAEAADYKARMIDVIVPPGSVLLFVEDIVHEIRSGKLSELVYRLFMGWRLTASNTPLVPDIATCLETQSIVPVKSLQCPPMYPVLYLVHHVPKLLELTTHVRPVCRVDHTFASGKRAGTSITIVRRFMPSLMELGCCYPPYTQAEIDILRPRPLSAQDATLDDI